MTLDGMQAESPTNATRLNAEGVAARVNGWLGAHQRLYLAAVSLFCVLTFAGYARVRFMVTDECLELTIIRLAGLRQIWSALFDGVQVDPPMLDSAMHVLFRLIGDSLFLARLPSVLCFCMLCVCLAKIVWRYAPPTYAAATFFLPFATILRGYASIARPYAPMLGFSALTLLCWDSMQNAVGSRQIRWRIAFLVSLTVTLSTHFYSILILVPLGLGELAKWKFYSRPDRLAILCMALALVPYCLSIPILVSASHIFGPHFAYRVEFQTLYDFFGSMLISLPWAVIVLLLCFARASSSATPAEMPRKGPASQELRVMLVVSGGFLLLPFCGYIGGVLFTGYFAPQYYMAAVFGLILGLPLLPPALGSSREVVGLCLFLAMAVHGLFVGTRGVSGFLRAERPYPALSEVRRLIPEPHPDIVVSALVHFLPFYEATKSDPENNLLYLFDPRKQLAEYGNDTADVSARIMVGRTPARIVPFDPYVATHRRFFILSVAEVLGIVGVQEWQFKYLLKTLHARLLWLGNVRGFDLYQVDLPALAADAK